MIPGLFAGLPQLLMRSGTPQEPQKRLPGVHAAPQAASRHAAGARDRSPDACRGPEPARVGLRPLGDTRGWHEHGYEKMLYCVRGQIVFHTAGGDIELGPGDKMVLPPHTAHAATVGSEGVRCIEAPRQPD